MVVVEEREGEGGGRVVRGRGIREGCVERSVTIINIIGN